MQYSKEAVVLALFLVASAFGAKLESIPEKIIIKD